MHAVSDLEALRRAAAILDPEMMENAPSSYDPQYTNPCWTAKDGRLSCLPYVFISGFSTGAESLTKKLQVHPYVVKVHKTVAGGCEHINAARTSRHVTTQSLMVQNGSCK